MARIGIDVEPILTRRQALRAAGALALGAASSAALPSSQLGSPLAPLTLLALRQAGAQEAGGAAGSGGAGGRAVAAEFSCGFGACETRLTGGFGFIATPSGTYSHDLALACVTLATQAYSGDAATPLLYDLGFDYAATSMGGVSEYLHPAASFAYKRLGDGNGGGAMNVFAIVVRGTSHKAADLPTDINDGAVAMFDAGRGAVADDFKAFAEKAAGKTVEELAREDNYILLTGHSLGGAVANALSVDGTLDSLAHSDKDRVYTYTFESPHTCVHLAGTDVEGMSNAFNFKDEDDGVTFLPPYTGATTYGRDVTFSVGGLDDAVFTELFPDAPGGSVVDAPAEENYGDAFGHHDLGLCLTCIVQRGIEAGRWASVGEAARSRGADDGADAWSAAYRGLVESGSYRDVISANAGGTDPIGSSLSPVSLSLYDVDADGTPELLITYDSGHLLGAANTQQACDVFSYADGGAVHCGGFYGSCDGIDGRAGLLATRSFTGNDFRALFYDVHGAELQEAYPDEVGAYTYSIAEEAELITLAGREVQASGTVSVAFTGYDVPDLALPQTDDPDLLAALQAQPVPLSPVTVDGLGAMGWEAFVDSQGFGSPLGWSRAFERFVMDEFFLLFARQSYPEAQDEIADGGYLFALHDLDGDGVPELVACNGAAAEFNRQWYVYGYKGQRGVYLGSLGSTWMIPRRAEDAEIHPGLFRWYGGHGSSLAYIYYYTVEGYALAESFVQFDTQPGGDTGRLEYTAVVDDTGLDGVWDSADEFLAAWLGSTELAVTSLSDIQAMGWDAFVESQGYEGDGGAVRELAVSFDDGDDGEQAERTISWGWDLFDRDASAYSHDLAWAALYLAEGTYHGAEGAEARMADLGFGHAQSHDYGGDWFDAEFNAPASTFASTMANIGGKERIVVAAAVRGSQDWGDWRTDLLSTFAHGNRYYESAHHVAELLRAYIDDLRGVYGVQATSANLVLLVCGHSLGGAVAGYLGRLLADNPAPQQRVFSYTFASPLYNLFDLTETYIDHMDAAAFDNVHNIVNNADIVTSFAVSYGDDYGRYGHDWTYDINFERHGSRIEFLGITFANEGWLSWNVGVNANHATRSYRACLEGGQPTEA